MNTEGRIQQTRRALTPPGEARTDWTILSVIGEVCATSWKPGNRRRTERSHLFNLAFTRTVENFHNSRCITPSYVHRNRFG